MFKRVTATGTPDDAAIRNRMPKSGTAVTLARSGGPTVAGTIGNLDARTFTIKTTLKGQAGQTYFINFQTNHGRHRFGSRCVEVTPEGMVLAYPPKIDTVDAAPPASNSGRQNVRLETALRCEWRVVKDGQPQTPMTRGTLIDISRTGASLICDYELKLKMQVEIVATLGSGGTKVTLPGEIMRVGRAEQSGKWLLGLHFQGLSAEQERQIMQYINHRQTERRQRGLL